MDCSLDRDSTNESEAQRLWTETDYKLSAVEMKSFNGPVKKLLFADELFSTGTKWTLTYIDQLQSRYKKELEDQTDEPSDDGDDDEDDEPDAEGGEDEDDEDDEEESEESD